MFRLILPVWLTVLAICPAGYAQDRYRIRIRSEEQVGDRHHVVDIEKTVQKILVTGVTAVS